MNRSFIRHRPRRRFQLQFAAVFVEELDDRNQHHIAFGFGPIKFQSRQAFNPGKASRYVVAHAEGDAFTGIRRESVGI